MIRTAAVIVMLTVTNPANCEPPGNGAAELLEQHKLPGLLFGPAAHASGYWICSDKKREKYQQQRAFDHRYGERVLRLSAEIERQGLANQDGYIVVNPCVRYTHRQRQQNLDAFESDLTALERRFGLDSR